MRFALLTIVLSYILMVQAALLPDFPSRVIPTTRMANLELHPFQISHFYSNSYKESGQSWNRTLTFLFTDPNANTSTICSASWTQTTRVTTPPTSYHSCYYNGNDEVFQWSFTAFKSLAQFSLVFRHAFKYPEYVSTHLHHVL
ncbi:hypothetical protein BJ878DRAFT_156744 [Calycina marina]|uniref:AA1-like domain-containing protein n=1 Tax=Calycina marina TaxID=1763456 RepID=A0A9P8CHS4_9HELO|nr:hypothetical protein BJ878DRAFT_156744 [Calycina marina]